MRMSRVLAALAVAALAAPAGLAITCTAGTTHIAESRTLADGVTAMTGEVWITGPSVSGAAAPYGSVPIKVTIGSGGLIETCLLGGVAWRYDADYRLTQDGKALPVFTERWWVPHKTSGTVTVQELWGGSGIPQYQINQQQIGPLPPAGYTWVSDGVGWVQVPNAAGGAGMADPGADGVLRRTGLNTTDVVAGNPTDCVLVDGTSGACGGVGAVSSVYGRVGVIVAQSGDYSSFYVPVARTVNGLPLSGNITLDTSLIGEVSNLYFTTVRARAVLSATSPIEYDASTGVFSCPTCGTSTGVPSVFGRTGNVTAQSGDYGSFYSLLGHVHIIANITGLQAALDGKQAVGSYEPANANIQAHIIDTSNPHAVTKTQVGLPLVDNTPDTGKPVSTAQAAALALKEALVNKDTNGGYVGRDSSGNAAVPGSITAQKVVGSATSLPGVLELKPGTAAAIIAAVSPVLLPAAGNCALFFDSADSNKPKLIDHSGTVTAWTAGCATSGGGSLSWASLTNTDWTTLTNTAWTTLTN